MASCTVPLNKTRVVLSNTKTAAQCPGVACGCQDVSMVFCVAFRAQIVHFPSQKLILFSHVWM